jgi:hypothetical protein
MKFIMWVIAVYFFIAVAFLFGFYVMINYNKKVNEYYKKSIENFMNDHPNFSQDAIENVFAAQLVRMCILWPKMLYECLKVKVRKEN